MPLILAVRNHSGQAGEAASPLRVDQGEVVVGRGAGSHLLIASQSVSRRHCTITGEGLAWRIVDSSSGGTFINGQRISAAQVLRHGDVIVVGEVEIAVMLDQGNWQGGAQPAPPQQPPPARDSWGRPAAAPTGQGHGGATQVPGGWGAAQAPGGGGQDAVSLLLQGAGLSRAQVGAADAQVAAVAGAVLRAALAGVVRLAQDRRKAREDLGVGGGAAEAGGLGAAASPEELLLRLLSGPPAEAATQVSALCGQIDTHQRAVLGAMQDTLHHALDQFSPTSIKNNARGDADAWKAYERAFDARDGFVEVFAQALARRYAEGLAAKG